jgi:hypothetical protein
MNERCIKCDKPEKVPIAIYIGDEEYFPGNIQPACPNCPFAKTSAKIMKGIRKDFEDNT